MTPSETPAYGLSLLVDKPLEWTSFDVVNKLRYTAKRITGRKKIKVGHAGTLDPLATGLVIICIGSHTKTINDLMGMDKVYEGTIRLGASTPSFDLETEVDQTYPLPDQKLEQLKQAAKQFEGEQDQIPPMFSAKKIDGKKAYEHARKGKEIELKAGRIRIDSFEVNDKSFPDIDFILRCSKGTYVRSLARDFGKALGSGAHLTRLRRTKIGAFSIQDALTIEQAMQAIEDDYFKYLKTNSL
ncbi:MAG: tRNA pseudouridine(55) synthase TruB [Flavobacteriales bacterium]